MSRTVTVNVKKIEVDIRATCELDGGVHFDSCWRNEDDPNGVWISGPVDLPYGPDHYRLVFDLDDRSGHGLEFYNDPDKAMYVQVGCCPTGAGDGGGQITFEAVTNGKKRLTVKDFNRDPPCDLHYMLRFDGDKHGACPPYKYDPEIRNGGGGT
jgi:hypothetical protein